MSWWTPGQSSLVTLGRSEGGELLPATPGPVEASWASPMEVESWSPSAIPCGLAYVLCGDRSQAEGAVVDAYAKVWPKWSAGRVDDLEWSLRRAVVKGSCDRPPIVRRHHEGRRTADRARATFEEGVADHDRLWSALRQLPPRQRQVVVLRYLEDLSETETARVLGVPPRTVRSRLARALSRLREATDEEQG